MKNIYIHKFSTSRRKVYHAAQGDSSEPEKRTFRSWVFTHGEPWDLGHGYSVVNVHRKLWKKIAFLLGKKALFQWQFSIANCSKLPEDTLCWHLTRVKIQNSGWRFKTQHWVFFREHGRPLQNDVHMGETNALMATATTGSDDMWSFCVLIPTWSMHPNTLPCHESKHLAIIVSSIYVLNGIIMGSSCLLMVNSWFIKGYLWIFYGIPSGNQTCFVGETSHWVGYL